MTICCREECHEIADFIANFLGSQSGLACYVIHSLQKQTHVP